MDNDFSFERLLIREDLEKKLKEAQDNLYESSKHPWAIYWQMDARRKRDAVLRKLRLKTCPSCNGTGSI